MRTFKHLDVSETLYFGYGSNLDERDWAQFCRKRGFDPRCLEPVGRAWLADFELVFDYYSPRRGGGALNLRPRTGQVVEGYLFRVTEQGWRAMDAKEGAPAYYERFETVALRPDGREVAVRTYRACAERVTVYQRPTEEYVSICRRGRQRFGLGTAMLEQVACGEEARLEVPGVFAYGTLMRGQARFDLASSFGLERHWHGRVAGRLHHFGQWPALSVADTAAEAEAGTVAGELLVPGDLSALLARLDVVEGFRGYGRDDNLFRRTLVEVELEESGRCTTQRAWAYVMDGAAENGEHIASGSWRVHLAGASPRTDSAAVDGDGEHKREDLHGAPSRARTIYQVQYDESVAAESPRELIEHLASTSMVPVPSTSAFRVRAAHWTKLLQGEEVRTDTDEHFVADMLKAGVYQIVQSH